MVYLFYYVAVIFKNTDEWTKVCKTLKKTYRSFYIFYYTIPI